MDIAYLMILALGLAAGFLSGIVGTGSSIILLPALVPMFGAAGAIPIMAIAGLMGNSARVLTWLGQVRWAAVASFAIPGIPTAALGALTLVTMPPFLADLMLGLFIIALVPLRRLLKRSEVKLALWHLAICGAAVGFLTGMFLSTGPLSVPIFLSYGLTKGAFIATEAASSIIIQLSKGVAFTLLGALTLELAVHGMIIGCAVMLGTFGSRRFVISLGPTTFELMMDAITLLAGAWLLLFGLKGMIGF